MIIHQLCAAPSQELARKLAEFEIPFTYPLRRGQSFRISHGEDYPLFFRALGEGACLVAEIDGKVIGTLGLAVRFLSMPDGTERKVAYLGDLKIAQEARGGRALIRLAKTAESWLKTKVEAGFSVVMGGTSIVPQDYTGRAGIPPFRNLGELVVLRIVQSSVTRPRGISFFADAETAMHCFRRWTSGRYACRPEQYEARSLIAPEWMMHPNQSAVGLLEDTRRAKRLLSVDGPELLSAHLSSFAYSSIPGALELIQAAVGRAVEKGLPALFTTVPKCDAKAFLDGLKDSEVTAAAATVYGTGLPAGNWHINSSEI